MSMYKAKDMELKRCETILSPIWEPKTKILKRFSLLRLGFSKFSVESETNRAAKQPLVNHSTSSRTTTYFTY